MRRAPLPRALRRLASALAFAALSTGCAAQSPRQAMAEAHAGAYVYHHPRGEVEDAVRALLAERGFTVRPSEGEIVRTAWRTVTDDEEFGDAYRSYQVVVHRLTREHSRVTATRLTAPQEGLSTLHPQARLKSDGMGRNVNTMGLGKAGTPSPIGKLRAIRDLDFEWELVRRLDPARARQIGAIVDHEIAHAR